jgi:hypothetical protein
MAAANWQRLFGTTSIRPRAAGILEQIERRSCALIQKHKVERIGIGFGGPAIAAAGVCTKSHQVAGWGRLSAGPLVP